MNGNGAESPTRHHPGVVGVGTGVPRCGTGDAALPPPVADPDRLTDRSNDVARPA